MAETIRAALERLLAVVKPTYTDPDEIVAAAHAIGAARAALAADGSAVQSREPVSVAQEPSDEELRDIWETGHLPSSEELANDDGEQDLQFLFTSAYYRWLEENPDAMEEHENKCIRAVFNAGRRWGHPEPVPVAERLPELRGMFERILCVARSSGQRPVGNIELADRLIKAVVSWSALPLPAGEVGHG